MNPHLDQGVESKGSYRAHNASANYFTPRPDVRTQVVDGETVLLDEREGHIHQLNHAASFIWHKCDGKKSVDDIIHLMTQEFDVQEEAAAVDVGDTIDRLRGLRLLRE